MLLSMSLLLLGCTPYRAGSFQSGVQEFPGERTTRGCLDLGFAATSEPEAEGPVIDLFVGNRCKESVWIDIPALEMTAYLEDGQAIPAGFYDPRDELRPALLGGKQLATERLELLAPIETLRVCAKLETLARWARSGPPQILCTEVQGV
jgi:hypothetical protein